MAYKIRSDVSVFQQTEAKAVTAYAARYSLLAETAKLMVTCPWPILLPEALSWLSPPL